MKTWIVELEGKHRVDESIYYAVDPFKGMRVEIGLRGFGIDGEGYVLIRLPFAIHVHLHSNGDVEVKYWDQYGSMHRLVIGKWSPDSKIVVEYVMDTSTYWGVLRVELDSISTFDAMPFYDRQGCFNIVSVPGRMQMTLHGQIVINIMELGEEKPSPPPQEPQKPPVEPTPRPEPEPKPGKPVEEEKPPEPEPRPVEEPEHEEKPVRIPFFNIYEIIERLRERLKGVKI